MADVEGKGLSAELLHQLNVVQRVSHRGLYCGVAGTCSPRQAGDLRPAQVFRAVSCNQDGQTGTVRQVGHALNSWKIDFSSLEQDRKYGYT